MFHVSSLMGSSIEIKVEIHFYRFIFISENILLFSYSLVSQKNSARKYIPQPFSDFLKNIKDHLFYSECQARDSLYHKIVSFLWFIRKIIYFPVLDSMEVAH
jgi:hypothetical protein